MWNHEKIKEFVRDTLGCSCPDQVFEKIDISKQSTESYAKEVTRIVIGDTLLIYLVCSEPAENLITKVEVIGSAGKADRDTNNYNRFRLVISNFDCVDQKEEISKRFLKVFDDEKMHIHFVSEGLLEGLCE